MIAVVSQEPILFNCSIEENIRFGRENITTAEMVHACRMANADTFIAQLPKVCEKVRCIQFELTIF